MIKEKVSIIIVNFNGIKWLNKCLDSVTIQDYPFIEVIFVDNASTDESCSFVSSNYPEIRIFRSEINYGFARGNNIGVQNATGDYFLLLNNDTVLPPDLVSNLINGMQNLKKASILQPKIYHGDSQNLDGCGSLWTKYTFLHHIGLYKKELNTVTEPFPVFSVKGAAMLVRKHVVDTIGLFDDAFWCYYEETDFCHRAWLSGFESWYYPKASLKHYGGKTSVSFSNRVIHYHNIKNKIRSYLKNFSLRTALWTITLHCIFNFFLSFNLLHRNRSVHLFSLFSAILWNIKNIRTTLTLRAIVQSRRKVSDSYIFDRLSTKTGLLDVYLNK